MAHAFPVLGIAGYDEALSFYRDLLGFAIDFEHRRDADSPVYMGISRGRSAGIAEGRLALHLTEHAVPLGASVLLDVEDVGAFHADLLSRAPDFEAPLQDKPWGKTELQLTDPAGNRLTFTSPTA